MVSRNQHSLPSPKQMDNYASEYELVTRAQQGQHQAFEELYERYSERIARYIACIVHDSSAGSELTQETFLTVWETFPSLRDPSCFARWLYRIATNKAYNYQKHARLLREVPWEDHLVEITAFTAFDVEQRVEEGELVRFVLSRVSPTYRACLILYLVEHLPRQQISDLLGIKVSSIDKYLSRGKEEFRQMYLYLFTHQQWETTKRA